MKKWFVIGLIYCSGPAFAGCLELEQEATVKVNAISAQMQGLSTCQSLKKLEQILLINVEFFDRCKESDPTGKTLRDIENSLGQTRQNINAICS